MSIKRFGMRLAPWLTACALSVSFSAVAADQDGDGIDDSVETAVGLDPAVANASRFIVDDGTGSAVYFNPDVAVDSEGRIHMSMQGFSNGGVGDDSAKEIYYALLSPDAELLIAPTIVNIPDVANDARPSIAVTSDGRAVIAWARNGEAVRMVTVDPSGDSQDGDAATPADILELTETAVGIATGPGHLDLAVNDDDNVVVMHDKGNLHLIIVGADGTPVVAETPIDAVYARSGVSLDFDSAGNIHAVYRSSTGTGPALYTMLNGATGAVMIDGTVVYDANPALAPRAHHYALHVDADDAVHIVYADMRNTIDADTNCNQCFQHGALFYTQLDPSLDDQSGDLATTDGTAATQIAIKVLDDVFLTNGWYSSSFVDENGLFISMPTASGKSGHSVMANDLDGNIVAGRRVSTSHRSSPGWMHKQANIDGGWAVWSDSVATDTGGTYRIILERTDGMIGRGMSGSAIAQSSDGNMMHFEAFAEDALPDGAAGVFPAEDFDVTGDYFRYAVGDLTVGGTATVTIDIGADLPEDFRVFNFDGSDWSEIGASKVSGTAFAVTLVDGGAGDADGEANGMIVDPLALATPVVVEPAAPVSISGGGGGGCVIGDENRPLDPLFPALLALAGAYFIRRRMTN